MTPITHESGKPDTRYTVEREHTGADRPHWVARFCGERIGSSISYSSAVAKAAGHDAARRGALVVDRSASTHPQYAVFIRKAGNWTQESTPFDSYADAQTHAKLTRRARPFVEMTRVRRI